jgi:sulfite reductase alpha subunit-like flavoprotein
MTENLRITDEAYERDARHYTFDFGETGFEYEVGDVL